MPSSKWKRFYSLGRRRSPKRSRSWLQAVGSSELGAVRQGDQALTTATSKPPHQPPDGGLAFRPGESPIGSLIAAGLRRTSTTNIKNACEIVRGGCLVGTWA